MTRSQGPSQGPSATASTSATRGQAAGNSLRRHYKKSRLPQTSLHGQDRQDTLKLLMRMRSGGFGFQTKLRALSQWRAGGVISCERRAWGSGNPGTREPAGGLGIATAGGGYFPQLAGMRARGQQTRLPRETKHRNKIKLEKTNKTR